MQTKIWKDDNKQSLFSVLKPLSATCSISALLDSGSSSFKCSIISRSESSHIDGMFSVLRVHQSHATAGNDCDPRVFTPLRRKWLLFAGPEETSQEKMRLCSLACISRLARPALLINHSCGYSWLHACDNSILPLYINLVCIHSTGLLLMSFLRPADVNGFTTSVVCINYFLISWFCSRVIIVN